MDGDLCEMFCLTSREVWGVKTDATAVGHCFEKILASGTVCLVGDEGDVLMERSVEVICTDVALGVATEVAEVAVSMLGS